MADHATIFYNSKNVQFGEEAASPSSRSSFGNPCYFWICRFTKEVLTMNVITKTVTRLSKLSEYFF